MSYRINFGFFSGGGLLVPWLVMGRSVVFSTFTSTFGSTLTSSDTKQ